MLKRSPFIAPALPVLRSEAPTGADWIHELKYGGVRVQLHKENDAVTIYSDAGHDITRRYPYVEDALVLLQCRSAIVDAELTCRTDEFSVWAFDLLRIDECDLRSWSLWQRRRELQCLIIEADDHVVQFSDDFDDPEKLLAVAQAWGLEGIVSKKLDQPFKSGRNLGWTTVKTRAWREANAKRWKQFVSDMSQSAPLQ